MEMRQERYKKIDTNFQEFAENRNSGSLMQFKEVFVRNWLFLLRNKKSFASIFFNAIIIALCMLAVFLHAA